MLNARVQGWRLSWWHGEGQHSCLSHPPASHSTGRRAKSAGVPSPRRRDRNQIQKGSPCLSSPTGMLPHARWGWGMPAWQEGRRGPSALPGSTTRPVPSSRQTARHVCQMPNCRHTIVPSVLPCSGGIAEGWEKVMPLERRGREHKHPAEKGE